MLAKRSHNTNIIETITTLILLLVSGYVFLDTPLSPLLCLELRKKHSQLTDFFLLYQTAFLQF